MCGEREMGGGGGVRERIGNPTSLARLTLCPSSVPIQSPVWPQRIMG